MIAGIKLYDFNIATILTIIITVIVRIIILIVRLIIIETIKW